MRKEEQLDLFAAPKKKQPEPAPAITSKSTIKTAISPTVGAKPTTAWRVYIDGASRGNPGKAGVGIFGVDGNNKTLFKKGFYLGERTNNQAEYGALVLAALLVVKHLANKETAAFVTFISDSELLVRQMSGHYKVKNERLKQLKEFAATVLHNIPHSFKHVLREYNKQADELANKGVDGKIKIPAELQNTLAHHKITL